MELCFVGHNLAEYSSIFFSNGISTSITIAEQNANIQVAVIIINRGTTGCVKTSYFSFIIIPLIQVVTD